MKPIRNFFLAYIVDYYILMSMLYRKLYNMDIIYNPSKAIDYELKKQKWENKVRS